MRRMLIGYARVTSTRTSTANLARAAGGRLHYLLVLRSSPGNSADVIDGPEFWSHVCSKIARFTRSSISAQCLDT
jgi:hypothetical protein